MLKLKSDSGTVIGDALFYGNEVWMKGRYSNLG